MQPASVRIPRASRCLISPVGFSHRLKPAHSVALAVEKDHGRSFVRRADGGEQRTHDELLSYLGERENKQISPWTSHRARVICMSRASWRFGEFMRSDWGKQFLPTKTRPQRCSARTWCRKAKRKQRSNKVATHHETGIVLSE